MIEGANIHAVQSIKQRTPFRMDDDIREELHGCERASAHQTNHNYNDELRSILD